jgi:hypothetical protein
MLSPSLGANMRRRNELRSVEDRARSNVETTARESEGVLEEDIR